MLQFLRKIVCLDTEFILIKFYMQKGDLNRQKIILEDDCPLFVPFTELKFETKR